MRVIKYFLLIFILFSCGKYEDKNSIRERKKELNIKVSDQVVYSDMKTIIVNNEISILVPEKINNLSKDYNNYYFFTDYENLIIRISWLDNSELGFRDISDVRYDLDDIVNSNQEDYPDFKFISKDIFRINGVKLNMFKFNSNYFFKDDKNGYKEMYSFLTEKYYYTVNINYTNSSENTKNEILNSLRNLY